ncbi:DUF6602 domain-containing protein [Vogesella facilis]|uniref:DUF6602 domain-containing protein n=1 Tax=Vogesella facilis TaxID=1655232 RepID=A0ABV7RDF1_9NEIS
MLQSHFSAIEKTILAISEVASNTGHNLHRGTPREVFIKEFLENHLSEKLGIGSGEIIDADSKPREPRNQIDIVIYRKEYPRLTIGGGITAFLAESVVAIIEVKSVLNEAAIEQVVGAAKAVKKLNRSFETCFETGHEKPGILSYVIAYEGPASHETIADWLNRAHGSHQIVLPHLPANHNDCQRTAWPSIDGIFVLGRGFMQADTSAITYITDKTRMQHDSRQWVWCGSKDGNLLVLFMLLTQAASALEGRWLFGRPYIERFAVDDVSLVSNISSK